MIGVRNLKCELEVRKILASVLSSDIALTVDKSVSFREMGVDSLAFIKILVLAEEKFGIEFPDEKLTLSQLGTIENLCNNIEVELLGEQVGV